MSKKFKRYIPSRIYQQNRQLYLDKYFDLFLTLFKTEDLTKQESDYFLKKLYFDGSIAVFKAKGSDDIFAFAPYAVNAWNSYDAPTKLQLINTRNAPFIPSKQMSVGTDCVIYYLRPNKKGLVNVVGRYASLLAEVDTALFLNLQLQKIPFAITGDKEAVERITDVIDRIIAGDISVFVAQNDTGNLSALSLNAPYLIDKLTEYRNSLESELKTRLGIDNSGVVIKKERLTADEVNSNNDELNDAFNVMLMTLEQCSKEMEEVFGTSIKFKPTKKIVDSFHDKDADCEEENITNE